MLAAVCESTCQCTIAQLSRDDNDEYTGQWLQMAQRWIQFSTQSYCGYAPLRMFCYMLWSFFVSSIFLRLL